ncbi:MAG: cyclic nucleotide-binding domain-containing protein [Alphaproteobacteria bacterium]|nr:cyclic nucleotide-binding domain-containing protein [Alphaproteobacteria bacterium]MBF0251156.1 cyclic nucleotide-binding domain-containing protein [Alphaproteobacteria bacterium]
MPKSGKPGDASLAVRLATPQDLARAAAAPLFAELSGAMVDDLLKDASVMVSPASGLLFSQNDPAEHFFVLLEGQVVISIYREDGSQAVIETLSPVATFAEAAMFLYKQYPATAEYAPGSRILSIPVDSFLRRLKSCKGAAVAMLGSLARWERTLSAQLDSLKMETPAQRLMSFLLGEAPPDQMAAFTVRLDMDKAVLARKLGITPESLSRLLARLGEHGVSSEGRDIHVADPMALRAQLSRPEPL